MLPIAIIFDMDGVIVDNYKYHMKSWMQFLEKHGFPISVQEYKEQINGRILSSIIPGYFGADTTPERIKVLGEEKESAYREIYQNDITATPGLKDFLMELENKNIPKAIATSAPPANVEFTLAHTGLKKHFPVITDDSMVTRGKPDPQVYLKSAELLHTDPARCVVFEDAILGIQAARNAGMKVVGLATTHPAEELNDVDMVISNFEGLTIDKLIIELGL